MNGFTYMSPEPMIKGKSQNMVHAERELWTLQDGKLKNGLSNRLLFFQERLDVLGKLYLYLN